MPLTAGTLIGPYEIVSPLGAGGMGEVYRARNSKLGREVALKVLPAALANDAAYLARFQREAQALAALNHPNIAAIYGLEDRAIIMELVEGQTLDQRISAGPIPVAEALRIARQIADALEAAHEKGIVHRDLKPANVKMTPEGVVKVLDFGLATAAQRQQGSDPANSPTLTMAMTQEGLIMGTAGYMSPEQASGRLVDKRADIFSFGVLLWEMLSGRKLFEGETVSHTLAHVLTAQPDWTALPESTPPGVRRLLQRCLEKDRKKRLRDIGDAWAILEEPEAAAAPVIQQPPARRSVLPSIIAAVLGILTATLGYVAYHHVTEQPQVARLSLLPPDKATFVQRSHPTLSPDGRKLTFIAKSGANSQLWVRDLDSLVARPLPGTDDSNDPFWSPDSRFIGFFAVGKLKKIEVAGGPAQTVCDAPQGRGGSWNRDGVIIFTPASTMPLFRVPAAGGKATQVTQIDASLHESSHRFPWFLPDGRHFLFLARGSRGGGEAVYAGDLESKERKKILMADSNAIYVPPGLVLFIREGTLMALPFDASPLQDTGDPFPVAEQVDWDANNNKGSFSLSQTGVLAYFPGAGSQNVKLTWFDRAGKALDSIGVRGSLITPALSPDGNTVAVDILDRSLNNRDIWLLGLARGTATRFTFDPGSDLSPVWSPDGSQVAFGGMRNGQWTIFRKAANGSGSEEVLITSAAAMSPTDWSRDGRFIVYNHRNEKGTSEIGVLPLSGERKPFSYLAADLALFGGKLSPDGRWMAYFSAESGRFEVYVQSFPNKSGKFQISAGGGTRAQWSRDGKEIFFVALSGTLMTVDVKAGEKFEAGTPKALFETRLVGTQNYAVSPDARRFLFPTLLEEVASAPLTVVLNWTAGLKK
jgi:serine/threonine protein kinase